jgi:hypothetical protein
VLIGYQRERRSAASPAAAENRRGDLEQGRSVPRIPAKREAAWRRFQPRFEADPDLLALAEGYKRYFASRH